MPWVGAGYRDPGGFALGRPQGALEETRLDAGLQEMGGVRMAEGRERAPCFGEPGSRFGGPEGALDTGATQRGGCGRTVSLVAPRGGKEPGGVTRGVPGGAEQRQRLCGERHVPVFGTRAAVDLDLEALAINGRDLQGEGCLEPEAHAGDVGAGDLVLEGGGRLTSSTLSTAGRGWVVCARMRARGCQSRWRTC